MTNDKMTARSTAISLTLSQRVTAGLALVFLGATLFFVVGLSDMAVAHNTAHDTRHAIGFPCH